MSSCEEKMCRAPLLSVFYDGDEAVNACVTVVDFRFEPAPQ